MKKLVYRQGCFVNMVTDKKLFFNLVSTVQNSVGGNEAYASSTHLYSFIYALSVPSMILEMQVRHRSPMDGFNDSMIILLKAIDIYFLFCYEVQYLSIDYRIQ